MLANQIRTISPAYEKIANNNPPASLTNQPTLASLLFKLMIEAADCWPDSSILNIYNSTKTQQEDWLLAVNSLCSELLRQLMYGPSSCYVRPELRPINMKKEMEFVWNPKKLVQVDYSDIAKQYGIVVPSDINRFGYEYLISEPFVKRKAKYLVQQLSVEGEQWVETVQYPHLFLLLKSVADLLVEDKSFAPLYKYLIHGRLNYIHNLIIDKPVNSLAEKCLRSYLAYTEGYAKSGNVEMTHFVAAKLQFSNVLLFYYKYTEAERCLELCKQVLNCQIEFTGRLGRRTKYQQFDTAQLVAKLEPYKGKHNTDSQLTEEDKEMIKKQRQELPTLAQVLVLDKRTEASSKLKVVDLDEESILLEVPKFTQSQPNQQQEITLEKQLLVLTNAYNLFESSPKQQTLFLKINAIIQTLLATNPPYSLKFGLLALRSLNEIPRLKNSDRAIEQLQQLVDQYNTLEKSLQDAVLVMSTPLVFHLRVLLLKMVAGHLFKYGLLMTGVEMYQKVGMYEECVEGLMAAGAKDRALKMAVELKQKQGLNITPRLLCMMAQLQKNPQGFKQAWQKSNGRYGRAQKYLGRYYFSKKDFQNASQAFRKSLGVNSYDPGTWFNLGLCEMAKKDMQEAVKCFSQTVSIDQTHGQGWGNLASCYICLKKYNEAYMTLEQAVKLCESQWRIWSNLLGVSIKIKRFYKYFECIQRLVQLGQVELITYEVLAKVVQVFQFKLAFFGEEKKRVIATFRARIQRLFRHLHQKMGEKPVVWKYYCEFLDLQVEYLQEMFNYYRDLHQTGKIDPLDLVAEYQTMEGMNAYTKQENKRILKEQIDCKQKQCNMLMVVGWETSKKQCELLVVSIKELVAYYSQQGKAEDKQLALFLKGIKKTIEQCLQRTISFESE